MKSTKIFIIFTFLLTFALHVSAQNNQFSNELKDYEFFGKGKLKGLVLGVSNKGDVRKIFGSVCDQSCSYDENWTISFTYFDDSVSLEIDGKVMFPKEKFYEKIWMISLVPKKNISFREAKFPKTYESSVGYIEVCSNNGCEKGSPKLKFYVNSDGLSYSICKQADKICKKDDLYVIRYEILEELENKIFDLEAK